MKGRLFILTNDPVPYGTANANYIRNFANAISHIGVQVIVIGMNSDPKESCLYCAENINNIQYWNINANRNGAVNYLKAYFRYGKYYSDALHKFAISEIDYIVLYSNELSTAVAVRNEKLVSGKHKAFCEVEWFQPYQYKHGGLNAMYILWKIGFCYRMKFFTKAIPISEKLEILFKEKGCSTLIVPALVDTKDMRANKKSDAQHVHFIYPGAASDKDSFPCMIKAFASLDKDVMKKVIFHLTGSMSMEKLRQIMGPEKALLEKLEEILVFHGWLEYDELMDLYGKTDYLLLARAKNVVTLSNFPSKVPEMLNYGVVPVCSAVGDYTSKYLVDGLDSIQFFEDDVASCANAIITAIKKKESGLLKDMQIAARRTAIEKLDYRNWGHRIVDFMER